MAASRCAVLYYWQKCMMYFLCEVSLAEGAPKVTPRPFMCHYDLPLWDFQRRLWLEQAHTSIKEGNGSVDAGEDLGSTAKRSAIGLEVAGSGLVSCHFSIPSLSMCSSLACISFTMVHRPSSLTMTFHLSLWPFTSHHDLSVQYMTVQYGIVYYNLHMVWHILRYSTENTV